MKPEKGTKYWTFYKGKVFEATWWNDMVDNERYLEGRVFKTMKEAKEALNV